MSKHIPAYIILVLLAFYILLSEFGYQVVHKTKLESVVITSDTTYQEKEKLFQVAVSEPKVIVIDKNKAWQEQLLQTFQNLSLENKFLSKINDSLLEQLNVYSDTLSDENLDIYYNSLIDGRLLASDIHYKLKTPKIITHNKIKTVSIPTKSNQWLIHGQLGGNKTSFNNLSLGVQHISKKGFSKVYRYNFLQNTHNVGIGYTFLNH